MTGQEPAEPEASALARDRSLPGDLRQLVDDARTLAEAEFAYQKARAAFGAQEAKRIAILGVVAAVLVFFAVMALVVGSVIALVPVLTAWGATAAVTGALLLLAVILLLVAKSRISTMKRVLSDEDEG
jgi:uncharacterized membrane protein YqjE